MSGKATCQCGQLSLTCPGAPEFTVVCNCKQCQVRSGSAFAFAAFFRRDAVTVEGEAKQWARPARSGTDLVNNFCPDCGTSLFWAPGNRPDFYGVAAGCLETAAPEPANVIWLSEKQDWLNFPDHWGHHDEALKPS